MLRHRSKQPACLAAAIALLWTAAGYAQEPPPKPTGSYVDGVFVENYVYKPNFISAQELKKLIDEKSKDIVIVDTAAAVIFDEQHIPGAVNFPYAPTLSQQSYDHIYEYTPCVNCQSLRQGAIRYFWGNCHPS